MANDIPGLIFKYHFHKHIAGEDLSLDSLGLSLFYGDFFLHGDKDFKDPVFHTHGGYALIYICLDLILISGIGLDDVPAAFLCISK